MYFDTYIEKTRETAVYPEEYERDYVIHGLVDELGELQRAITMVARSENPLPPEYSRVHVEQICKEMGDGMWYLARLCDHFDFDLSLDDSITKKSIDLKYGEAKAEQALLAATKINGHQKKSVRDNSDRRRQIRACAKEVLKCLQEASHHLGVFNLEVVMRKNLEKLFDRKDRNVLHGDGDNR